MDPAVLNFGQVRVMVPPISAFAFTSTVVLSPTWAMAAPVQAKNTVIKSFFIFCNVANVIILEINPKSCCAPFINWKLTLDKCKWLPSLVQAIGQ